MKIVPDEPTEEMTDAVDNLVVWIGPDSHDLYQTMLAASPHTGKVSREMVERAQTAMVRDLSSLPLDLSRTEVYHRQTVAVIKALGLEVEDSE